MKGRRKVATGLTLAWLDKLLHGRPETKPRQSTGTRPSEPMTLSEREKADEAWKQAMREYDDPENEGAQDPPPAREDG